MATGRVDPEQLVARACDGGMVPEVVLRIHQVLDALPPAVTGATPVSRSAPRLVDAVAADAPTSAQVVRLADARAGGQGAVTGLRDAVDLLGPEGTRDAVWVLCVASEAASSSDPVRRTLWTHALRTGCIAAALSRDEGDGAALLAGVLHDLGLLMLYDVGPPTYREVLRRAGPTLTGLVEMEHHGFGWSHADLGARALRAWSYPEAVVEAVASHHGEVPDGLTAVVACADLVETWLAMGAPLADVVAELRHVPWYRPPPGEIAPEVAIERALGRATWFIGLAGRGAALHVPGG